MKWLLFSLILLLIPKDKDVIWRYGQTSKEELCSDQIIFYTDHFVIYHMGCEANNNLRFGTWKLIGDSTGPKFVFKGGPANSLKSAAFFSSFATWS